MLPADCCFSEPSLKARWSSTKRTSSSYHWKLTCSRHDITEKIAEMALNNNHSPALSVFDLISIVYNINEMNTHLCIFSHSFQFILHISSCFTCLLVKQKKRLLFWLFVFNLTFSIISVISCTRLCCMELSPLFFSSLFTICFQWNFFIMSYSPHLMYFICFCSYPYKIKVTWPYMYIYEPVLYSTKKKS